MTVETSENLFRIFKFIWKISGFIPPRKHQFLYFLWVLVFNVAVTLIYPLHLALGLIQARTKQEAFKNLAITITDFLSMIKFLIIWYNLKRMHLIGDIFKSLDERIQTHIEKKFFLQIVKHCKWIFYFIAFLYINAWLTTELATLFDDKRRLMFPAWLPFDWNKSATNYWIAHFYQFIGITLHIFTTYGTDTYPPVCLATLSGHIRLLALRLSNLGTDSSSNRVKNNNELRKCIDDHKRLIEIHFILNKVLSKGMFFQIVGTGLNICCTIIYLTFYADNVFAYIYYTLMIIILPLQIFPSCYFGSDFEMEWANLPYALFSCNWTEQDKQFKQNMIIFSQRCAQKTSFVCMDFFKINLDSFFVTMRGAYSLFAVVMQAK